MATLKFEVKSNVNIEDILDAPCSEAEKWVANEVMKDTAPYVPYSNGALEKETYVRGNYVIYDTPYARYLYYGKVMKGPKHGPKYATDKNLVFDKSKHAKAQAKWFEASKAQNLQKWIRGAAKIVAKRK